VKVDTPKAITSILDDLLVVLNGTPPPWLRKVLAKGEEKTFDFDEEEQ